MESNVLSFNAYNMTGNSSRSAIMDEQFYQEFKKNQPNVTSISQYFLKQSQTTNDEEYDNEEDEDVEE